MKREALTPKQLALQRNKSPLSRYLRNYDAQFSKSIDELWDKYDVDKNNWLDREEAKKFIEAVAGVIDPDRAKLYENEKFDTLFDRYDEDQNGYLSKGEAAQFIKISFSKSSMIN